MSVTVVIGGLWGSEGKGKIAASIPAEFRVRTGGPNAGHTLNGVVWRQLPCTHSEHDVLMIPPGACVDPNVLDWEVSRISNKVVIDRGAAVILPEHLLEERGIVESIGSVGSGTGSAEAQRVMRRCKIARDYFTSRTGDVPKELRIALCNGLRVLIETTQGFGLSCYHGQYPYCTSRDVTTAAALSACGLPPRVDRVVLVLRTWPIRVGGCSGPLPGETTWDKVPGKPEYGSVTGRLRRVAHWCQETDDLLLRGCYVNGVTEIAITALDRLENPGRFIDHIETLTGLPVTMVSYTPDEVVIR